MIDADTLQAISSILSVVIALVALITAVRSEGRANKQFKENLRLQQEADERAQQQFEENLRLQREVVELNQKPVLTLGFFESFDEHSVSLSNVGNGTAVITNMRFTIDEKQGHNIHEVITFPEDRPSFYQNMLGFSPKRPAYVKAGVSIKLFSVNRAMYDEARNMIDKLSVDFTKELEERNLSPEALTFDDEYIQEILASVKTQLSMLNTSIEYEDILGNQQPNLSLIRANNQDSDI